MALIRLARVVAALAAVFGCCSLPCEAGSLRKVWEVDLKKAVRRADGMPTFPVFGLRFSPDGRQLALIADVYDTSRRAAPGEGIGHYWKDRLLVIDVNHPADAITVFGVKHGFTDGGAAVNFGWSPSSKIVYAVGTLFQVATGLSCELPNESVFINGNMVVSPRLEPPTIYSRTEFTFFDQDCKEQGKWVVPEGWLISDVSLDGRVLSISRAPVPFASSPAERLVVDPLSRSVLERWPEEGGGVFEFADQGRALCQSGKILASDHAPARCQDAGTGKEIAETTRNGGEPIAAAAGARRVVVSDYRRWKPTFDNEYRTKFEGRYVWDFGTGKELASWLPQSETYENLYKPGQQITELFHFAISPDGQYIAEGGNGIVRLYKIEP